MMNPICLLSRSEAAHIDYKESGRVTEPVMADIMVGDKECINNTRYGSSPPQVCAWIVLLEPKLSSSF